MIITKLERLIVDDYPRNIEKALIFFCSNKIKIAQSLESFYHDEQGVDYLIFNQIPDKKYLWHSYRNVIQIYIIISGELFLEFADVDTMISDKQEDSMIFYQGIKEGRIKLSANSIAILFPEEVHRLLPTFHKNALQIVQIPTNIGS
ncbi:MAG: YhcH/YjgK/YiaL family protein [Brevinema sp.]